MAVARLFTPKQVVTRRPGVLIERIQGDVTAVNSIWAGVATGIGRDVIAVIALFSVAIAVDWKWTMIALIGVPFLVAPSMMAQAYVRKRASAARALAGRMSTRLDEVFHGINPIKLNGLERYQSQRYAALQKDRVKAEVKAATGQAAIPALIDVMTGLGFFGVLIFGGAEIIDGEKTVGQFMSFFTAMSLAFDPLRRLGALSGQMQMAAASMDRIQDILLVKPTLVSPAAPVAVKTTSPAITFDNVALQYGDLPVLRDASFTAAAGQTTALVGASGAGKSTVFNVLTRLVDPQEGHARIDGTAVGALDLADLRALFSVVTQDAALFDESLRDNILLGRTDIGEDRLNAVLEAAHVTDFLPQLPDGLDSPAGPRGSNLSGGQRQRVAIARITNDVQRAHDGIVYAALLTPQGKFIADFFVVGAADRLLIDVATSHAPSLAQRLNMYRLRADVQIAEADIIVSRGTGDMPADAHADPRHAALGWRHYGDADISDETDWTAINVAQLVPTAGVELTPDSYILEMGFERLNGIDFKKGCYVGRPAPRASRF